MNRRSKTALLALLAIFAVSAIASASALAAPNWQVEGVNFTGTETVNITDATPLQLTGTLGTSKVEMECTGFTSEGAKITLNNKGSSESVTMHCSWKEGIGCSGAGTLHTHSLGFSLEDVGNKVPLFTKLEPAENVLVSWVETGCLQEGPRVLGGSPRCQWVNPTVQSAVKVCEFTAASGSTLTFGTTLNGGKPMTITGSVDVELTGKKKGQKWGATP